MGWDEMAKRFSFGTLGTPLKHADAKAARNQHVHQEKRTNKNSWLPPTRLVGSSSITRCKWCKRCKWSMWWSWSWSQSVKRGSTVLPVHQATGKSVTVRTVQQAHRHCFSFLQLATCQMQLASVCVINWSVVYRGKVSVTTSNRSATVWWSVSPLWPRWFNR